MEKISVNRLAYELLYYECFKTKSKSLETAIRRAYRDLCRTMNGFGSIANKDTIKESASNTIKSRVVNLWEWRNERLNKIQYRKR